MSANHEKPSRILVVEDNPADVMWLRHALDHQQKAYVLEVLPDGEAALQFVDEHRTGSREPDPCVIVLDLHLPKHNGITVLHAIKRDPQLAHIQVVVLSSLTHPRDEDVIAALGAICRIKPSTLRECLELAAEILEICSGLKPPLLMEAAS